MKTLQSMTNEQLIGMCDALKLALFYDSECDVLSYTLFKYIDYQMKRLEKEINKRCLDI